MEKIYYRRCESYSVIEGTESVEVDADKLRLCIPPYKGDSNIELLEYIGENIVDDFHSWAEMNREIYGEGIDHLYLEESEMTKYFDSRSKYGTMWSEVGETNPEYIKNGGFITFESNQG